jgi:hypothetical protein
MNFMSRTVSPTRIGSPNSGSMLLNVLLRPTVVLPVLVLEVVLEHVTDAARHHSEPVDVVIAMPVLDARLEVRPAVWRT